MPILILLGLGAAVALVALSRSKAPVAPATPKTICSDEVIREAVLIVHATLKDLINETTIVPLSAKQRVAAIQKQCGQAAINAFARRNPVVEAETRRLISELVKKRGGIAPSPGITPPSVV